LILLKSNKTISKNCKTKSLLSYSFFVIIGYYLLLDGEMINEKLKFLLAGNLYSSKVIGPHVAFLFLPEYNLNSERFVVF
jgi:hypothetical protein